jgi:ring-1,2-phenylacetyl-CoA epoxidase subunit PaaE
VRLATSPDLQELFRFEAGQHLTLRVLIEGQDVRRNYSVCAAPDDGELWIAIKQVQGGLFSPWANTVLKAGDRIEAMRPHGSFTWRFDGGEAKRYVGLVGGSGITPVLSLIKTALATEPRSTFSLFYGNRSTASIIFLEELAALKNRYLDRLEVFHFLEDELDEIEFFNGRLDREKCDALLASLIEPDAVDAFFICGPGPMMEAAEAALLNKGVGRDRIRIERFTTGAPTAAARAHYLTLEKKAAGLKLMVTLDQKTTRIGFDAEAGNILESARKAGLPAPYACKAGVCATCRAKVVSGKVEMKSNYGLTEEEVAQGYVLTCQSVPIGEGVVVNYDQ